MKRNNYSVLLVFLFLSIHWNSYAQTNDFRMWFTAGIEKKITSKINLEASGSLRLNENISEIGSYYGDLGVGYKLMKRLKLGVHYRYSGKSLDDGTFHKRHRYYIDLSYKIKTGTPFSITARGRYQKQYTDIYSSEDGFNPANTIRCAVVPSYKYKQYEPHISGELFYLLDNSEKYFNRIRFKAGTEYNFNKRNKIDIFYMIQQELNSSNPTRAYILGFSYKYIL